MYRVKEFFNDLQDRKETKAGPIFHAYYPGDEYPRAGYKPSAERIAELATSANARGLALFRKSKNYENLKFAETSQG